MIYVSIIITNKLNIKIILNRFMIGRQVRLCKGLCSTESSQDMATCKKIVCGMGGREGEYKRVRMLFILLRHVNCGFGNHK